MATITTTPTPWPPVSSPETPLIDSLTLTGSYSDADGGKQALEIMAEAIQSAPEEAAGQAWGVTITPGRVAGISKEGTA